MLNLAGSSYDFGNVLFAVFQECEHRRRALLPNESEQGLMDVARKKLAEVRESYEEAGGSHPYWEDLEREVLTTAMPQYIARAVEQTRLEKEGYDVWRKGDPAARATFGLLGLLLGAIIIAIPWIPIFEDAFAFLLAAVGLFYPEVKKGYFDYRYSRFLNHLIQQGEKYQKNSRIHFLSNARIEEELRSLEAGAGAAEATPAAPAAPKEAAKLRAVPPPPEANHSPERGGQKARG